MTVLMLGALFVHISLGGKERAMDFSALGVLSVHIS